MPGRGDNNKHGSAGRGSSNQSNQPFVSDDEVQPKSNHGKVKTGTKPSVPSPRTANQDDNRNQSLKEKHSGNGKLRQGKMPEKNMYDSVADETPNPEQVRKEKEDPKDGNIGKNNAGGFEHQQ